MDRTQTTDFGGGAIDVLACVKGKTASLSERNLSQLPRIVCSLDKLEGLVLSGNILIDLPDTISNLSGLRILEVSDNRLSSLPSTISCLTKLRTVNASKNQLRFIPQEISALLNLTILAVSSNNIELVPAEIGYLKKLKMLDLSDNRLTVLPKELSCLVELSHLDIHTNPITRLLRGTANLTSLSIFIMESKGIIMVKSGPIGLSNLPCWSSTERPYDTMKWTISESLKKIELKDVPDPSPPILDPFHATVSSIGQDKESFPIISCESFRLTKRILLGHFKKYPTEMFNGAYDKCFCSLCFAVKSGVLPVEYRGNPPAIYVPPAGWFRVGLSVDKGFAKYHKVFENWHYSFHGTSFEKVRMILEGNSILLKAGDVAIGGNKLRIVEGHINTIHKRTNLHTGKQEEFNPHQIFTSPSIIYSSNELYAEPLELSDPMDPSRRYRVRLVLQTRQRPGSYAIGQETIGARGRQIDPHIPNSSIEYYTQESIGIVVYGILVQLEPVQ